MKSEIWATHYHKNSSDSKPQYGCVHEDAIRAIAIILSSSRSLDVKQR